MWLLYTLVLMSPLNPNKYDDFHIHMDYVILYGSREGNKWYMITKAEKNVNGIHLLCWYKWKPEETDCGNTHVSQWLIGASVLHHTWERDKHFEIEGGPVVWTIRRKITSYHTFVWVKSNLFAGVNTNWLAYYFAVLSRFFFSCVFGTF